MDGDNIIAKRVAEISEDEIEEELGGLMDTDDLGNMNGLTEYDGDFDRFSEPR